MAALSKDDIRKEVQRVIEDVTHFPANQIKDDTRMVEDIGLDSIGAVRIPMDLEERFGINLSDCKMPPTDYRVGQLISTIEERLQTKK